MTYTFVGLRECGRLWLDTHSTSHTEIIVSDNLSQSPTILAGALYALVVADA
jgi:hypothetical protein